MLMLVLASTITVRFSNFCVVVFFVRLLVFSLCFFVLLFCYFSVLVFRFLSRVALADPCVAQLILVLFVFIYSGLLQLHPSSLYEV